MFLGDVFFNAVLLMNHAYAPKGLPISDAAGGRRAQNQETEAATAAAATREAAEAQA